MTAGDQSELPSTSARSSAKAQLERRLAQFVAQAPTSGGWTVGGFRPDLDLLGRMLALTDPRRIREGSVPTGLDFWVAATLRQARIHNVIPQASEPFHVGRLAFDASSHIDDLRRAANILAQLQTQLGTRLTREESRTLRQTVSTLSSKISSLRELVRRSATSVLGESRKKQVDVFIADWDRGLELLISTKTVALATDPRELVKNLPNRWEEFDGDLKNLRGRFPLAVIGALVMVPATAIRGPLQAFVDMMVKLTASDRPWVNAYDATSIIVVDWENRSDDTVPVLNPTLGPDQLPGSLQPDAFFNEILRRLLERTPIDNHVDARVAAKQALGLDTASLRSGADLSSLASSSGEAQPEE